MTTLPTHTKPRTKRTCPWLLLNLLRCLTMFLVSTSPLISNGSPTGTVSRDEYLKMKRYLSFINKPYVKSFKTMHGHIFDCVDIYKQPALDHPLLKNHSIKMKPSFMPEVARLTTKAKKKLENTIEVCPSKTVPIQRVLMEDLLKAGSVSNYLAKPAVDLSVHRYAVMSSRQGKYLGTEATLNLWNPHVDDESQFSLTQLWLMSGAGDKLNTIEVGWHVYPQIYNRDSHTRLFTYWTADNYGKTGCYNVRCAGFVVRNQSLSPGTIFEPVSAYDEDQYELSVRVLKDEETGDWWLSYGKNHHPVGYWPSELFDSLDKFAAYVQWGGETFRGNLDSFPPMGSGLFANRGRYKSAYVKEIMLVGEDEQEVDASIDVGIRQTNGCYSLVDGGNGEEGSDRYFYYGGPGGTCLLTFRVA